MIHPGSVVGFAPEFVHAWSRLALMPSSCAALASQNQPRPDVYLLVSELNVLFYPPVFVVNRRTAGWLVCRLVVS